MKKLLFILFFCSFNLIGKSQVDTLLLKQATELFSTGDYEQSLTIFQKTLTQALQNGDKKRAIRIYFNIGKIYGQLGKPLESLQNYQSSEKLAEETGDRSSKAKALNNIGALYREQKNFSKALVYHAKAEAIALELKDSLTIADCANNTGIVYEMQQKFDTAVHYYEIALDIYKKIQNDQRISIALNNLGVMYKNMDKYPQAIDYYKQALVIAEKLGDQFVIAANNVNIASALNKTNGYAEALAYNVKGFAIAEKIGALDILVASADNMAVEYAGLKDYPKAYEWQHKFSLYSDSLINIERNKQMADAEAKYQTAQKEKQIQQQKFELTKKNYWLFGSIGLFILLSLLSYSFYRRYKLRQETKLRDAIIKQQDLSTKAVLEAEENERKRIAQELHDGVGQMMSAAKMNLSAFESDLQLKDKNQKMAYDKIVSLVDESCKEVRSVSHQMMPNALLKKGLANAIREFIDKIDSRILKVDLFSEGLNERIDSNAETVLYRVIQECVNNVIKHSGANQLDISLIKDIDGISITIEDNGKGFDISQKENIEGIGLKNMRTRIEYLKGTIEFDSTPEKGTLVAINVPV
ncbi:sensor histidine kinase [Ferruginibacter lapsinanis]|uniref:tetratricopeptide repeat-containing sensor histidine kinase n=1 Tax=Ferruginibacter lapsinanis TaxID=563172 RepID=UPI001E3C8787|nr:sensor histidine kinase [Ferruginibacter lapsinanis]UEG50705.1 sensor histidine kinase [Ferruginibacter lapsinanis]